MEIWDSRKLVAHCEAKLAEFGDDFRGVGWTKRKEYADLRYRVMLDGIRPEWKRPLDILDFGCGASHLYEYIRSTKIDGLNYSGLDLSKKFLDLSREKFPGVTYYHADLMSHDRQLPTFDYIILNGLFNNKLDASHDALWQYCEALLTRISALARRGFAFNVMSKYLDWERDDLFHVPFDKIASFLNSHISRYFTIRHDYGLFEYTVYVYREPLSDLY